LLGEAGGTGAGATTCVTDSNNCSLFVRSPSCDIHVLSAKTDVVAPF